MNLTTIIIAVLGGLLALSVAGNGILASKYVGAREEIATVTSERGQAIDAAMTCNASIADLEDAATKRAAAALPALAEAKAKALTLEQRAQRTLSAPPAVPGNDCASAKVRAGNWLKARAKP